MISRGRLQSVSSRRRRQQVLKIRFVVFGLLTLVLFGGVVFVAHLSYFRVENIYTQGNQLLSDDTIRSITRESLAGNYFLVFPKNNSLYFSRSAVEKALLNSHLEIKNARVSFKDLTSITVAITERKPFAFVCPSTTEEIACYLSDDTGYLFKEGVLLAKENPYLLFVQTDPVALSSQFLTPQEFKDTIDFVKMLKDKNLTVSSIMIKQDGVREATMGEGERIIWNKDEDLALAFQNLMLLISSPKFDGKTKDGRLNVEYIDIQNENKVFYKLK